MTTESSKRGHDSTRLSRSAFQGNEAFVALTGFWSRIWSTATVAVVAAALGWPGAALANHSLAEHQSTGPNGGNGTVASVFRGASADGTRVFFQTTESLVAADTDSAIDVYERSNGVTTQLSVGPNGGNGAFSAIFLAASENGTRVFIRTAEKLVASDTDNAQDIYERSSGSTTLISTGPSGGNGSFNVVFDRITADGSKVFFDTYESLAGGDADGSRDVYQRSGGTTTHVSTGPIGGNGAFDAFFDGVSDDGSTVFFNTDEPLVSSDFDERQDVYMRGGGTTTHLSIGPAGGNGNEDFDYDAFFAGTSADGSRAWLTTDEVLTFDDADTVDDVYERSGGGIVRISGGPAGGNGPNGAFFDFASEDGGRVFIDTIESLVAADTDSSYDIYEVSGGQTTLVSVGPSGGNGAFFTAFRGSTPNGSHVFFETYEPLTAGDTDANQDVYVRSGGATTLVSSGPLGGNGDVPASFQGSSENGSRVFFGTAEALVATDADEMPDTYERFGGATTLISTGPAATPAEVPVTFTGASADGTRVFFETAQPLVATDTDSAQDVYGSGVNASYPRPRGATPFRVPLVPAFQACAAPNSSHGAPLAFPSCKSPTQTSSFLTVGTPDANGTGANSTGSVTFTAVAGNAGTPADEADMKILVSLTDVRRKSDLADYTGQLQLLPTLRITDRLSGSVPVDPATVTDLGYPVTVPCTATTATTVGSTCSVSTTADAVTPGLMVENRRTILEIGQVKVFDGGADGLAATPGNTLFASEGVFVP
jgi:hypothetical protein